MNLSLRHPELWMFFIGDNMEEKFQPVVGYEGYYEVSESGNIYRCERTILVSRSRSKPYWLLRPRIKVKTSNRGGYLLVDLCKGSKNSKRCSVHRLVGIAFIPNPLNLPEINHKDGIKNNNRVTNLEWSTHQNNVLHAIRTGLSHPMPKKGEQHSQAKLTIKKVTEIKQLLASKKYSQYQIAAMFGVSKSAIESIAIKRTWWNV